MYSLGSNAYVFYLVYNNLNYFVNSHNITSNITFRTAFTSINEGLFILDTANSICLSLVVNLTLTLLLKLYLNKNVNNIYIFVLLALLFLI